METQITKDEYLDLLQKFVNQRSGIDTRNYFSDWGDMDGRKALNQDLYVIKKDGKIARELIAFCRWGAVSFEHLIDALPRGGRLTFDFNKKEFDYCAGQYFPTEYRGAVIEYLSFVVWNYFSNCGFSDRKEIIKVIKRNLGSAISKLF